MTNSYVAEREEIKTYLNNNFSSAPVQFPNQEFDRPEDSEWVRFTINNADAVATDIAKDSNFRHTGVLVLQVFTPYKTGDNSAITIADELADLFRYKNLGDLIRFRTPTVKPAGIAEDDDSWWLVNVFCPFQRDTIF